MNTFHSPYNFIPMAKEVHYPQWQAISHDQPIEDGLSGEITYELTNDSPLLVGDEREKINGINNIHFFETPTGEKAIPGSSIKGAIRNWVEIATHSKMNLINDEWLSYRDLQQDEYKNKLSGSKAGWLRFEEGRWQLYAANLWLVKSTDINKLFNKDAIKEGRSSKDIYEKIGGLKQIGFTEYYDGKKNYATQLNKQPKGTDKKGWVVVTGQIQRLDNNNSKSKKHNYIFSLPESEPLIFKNEQVIEAFLDIVGAGKKEEGNTFDYLKQECLSKTAQDKGIPGIPVFYIQSDTQVTHIGLSKMFRFAYKHSIGELRHDSHQQQTEKLDFSELLFGTTNEENAKKGRVNFSLANCISGGHEIDVPVTTLGAPKSSFYPAYIDQTSATKSYHTYNQNTAKLAGFKRYGVHPYFDDQTLPSAEFEGRLNENIAVKLRPVAEDSVFTGKIRFNNLKPQELGAVLYALTITEEPSIFQQLGMGKPLGLGKVQFKKTALNLSYQSKSTIDELTGLFKQYVEQTIQAQQTLNSLKAMQCDRAFPKSELAYLAFPRGFRDVKDTKTGCETLLTQETLVQKMTDEIEKEERRQKTEQKEAAKNKALSEASEEEKIFIELNQMLDQAKTESTSTSKKNIAKELNKLYAHFTSQDINEKEKTLFEVAVQQASELVKPKEKNKISQAVKKINRDILN